MWLDQSEQGGEEGGEDREGTGQVVQGLVSLGENLGFYH